MIGKKEIVITAADILQGMSSSPDSGDGGFSPETTQVNPLITEGVLYAPAAPTDKSTNLAGNILASCEDPQVLGNARYFLDDAGKYYTWNTSTLTLKATDSTNTYVFGTSDFVPYMGAFYATTANAATGDQVVLYDGATTVTPTWWHTTKSQAYLNLACRHPLLVQNKTLYIGDKNLIHSWDNTNVVNSLLTLATDQSITALGTDPTSGKMLVAVSTGTNYSNSQNTTAYIGLYDGVNPTQFVRKIPVEEQIDAFYNVGGITFVTYGQNLGYFTGTGVKFLRRFKNVTLNGANLAYKHHITNILNTLYIVDGNQILAFGEIIKNQPVFYYLYANTPSGTPTNIGMIANVGNNILGIGYSTNKFFTLDTRSVASSNLSTLYSKKYQFARPIEIETAKVLYDTDIASGVTVANLYTIDHNGVISAAYPIKNNDNSARRIITLPNIINKYDVFQIRIVDSTGNYGFKAFIATYDVYE